ncbi:Pre-mRNA-splicing ATP-dependent RNA helicase prp-28 [Xylariaceae sp. FL1019]|nr:Pre-mRNA-splicing ATP-dependent RNA helicase prp-28 [Xylariaceae sp. FL1019]
MPGPRAVNGFVPRFIPKAERERMAKEKEKQEEEKRNNRTTTARPRDTTARSRDTTAAVPATKRKTPYQDVDPELRARYMGPELNQSKFSAKKKARRHRDKFNFDWDAKDDTTQEEAQYESYAPVIDDGGLLAKYHDRVDPEDMKIARGIIAGDKDPVSGRERARDFLEGRMRAKQRADRDTFGKHWSEKELGEMRERDWRIFKEDFAIATKGGLIPNPMRNWKESGLPRRLLDIVAKVGYDKPHPVQQAAIPIALQNRDLIGVAVTGSGKTAAFLLPLLVYISELPPLDEFTKNDGPYSLIIAPTRELVQQIETEAKKFAEPLGFTVVSIVGGHAIEEQAYQLRNGAEIIVATPGRLVDCIERRVLVLSQCCYIIMDEADRMIDMGFEEPVNKILDALPVTNEKPDTEAAENAQLMSRHLGGKDRYRQTMMYTATMPPAVEKIAKKYLRRPATVTIGNAGEAVETVEQRVEFVSGEDRRKKRLQDILTSGEFAAPIIVFVNIKNNCDAVAREIKRMGFSTATLHGSKTQEQREASLKSVLNGQTEILVATDLAGRGIDVPDVSLVVNFNMAPSIESYTHRIGRTGRAGKSGVAITFLGNEDTAVMYDLRQMLSKSKISKVPEELRAHEASQQKYNKGMGKKIET